jgi:hypothetical protein
MKMSHQRAALAFVSLGLISTTVHACERFAFEGPTIYLSAESPVRQPAGKAIGDGPHSYRFVVRDPQHIKRPYRNGRYQLELKGDARFPDGTQFYRGTTDSRGRTATFRFAQPLSLEEWFVQPLAGQGEFGETFHLSEEGSCGIGLVAFPYMINGNLGPIFCGETLPGGMTIRYMMPFATGVQVYHSQSTRECKALQRRVNPVMARPTPAQRISGLQQLLRDRRLSEHEDMLQGKIDALLIRHGSLAQIKADHKHKLADVDETSSQAQSAVYNELAYSLIDQKPPRHLAYANDLLDKSLSLDKNPFNMDSKAWALHLMGRDDEALGWMNRVLPLFGTQCSAAEKASYQESLAHRGMILWSLKQVTEALTDWAKADIYSTAGGWANYIPSWPSIGPLIKVRTEELRGEGFVNTICSEARPEEAETAPEETAKGSAND